MLQTTGTSLTLPIHHSDIVVSLHKMISFALGATQACFSIRRAVAIVVTACAQGGRGVWGGGGATVSKFLE